MFLPARKEKGAGRHVYGALIRNAPHTPTAIGGGNKISIFTFVNTITIAHHHGISYYKSKGGRNMARATNHKYSVSVYLGKENYQMFDTVAKTLKMPIATLVRLMIDTGIQFSKLMDEDLWKTKE